MSPATPKSHIKYNRCQQNAALYHLLQVLVHAHDAHAQIQHAHKGCAHDNPGDRTGAAVCGSAADEARADGIHLIAVSGR